MSISLVLIPLALAIRAAISAKDFDRWLESNKKTLRTTIDSEELLEQILNTAGYDFLKYGGVYKTHFHSTQNPDQYLLWEKRSGKWQAIFDIHDQPELIQSFVDSLEQTTQQQIFLDTVEQLELQAAKSLTTAQTKQAYPTNFKDREVLLKTLLDFGIQINRSSSPENQFNPCEIDCIVGGSRLLFKQEGESPFYVEIENSPNIREIYLQLSMLDEEYKKSLQSLTYEKIKNRAAARQLEIESEEILEDQSIMITLNINRRE